MTIIALLSDFGIADSFVGSMKGAILSINPRATIVDITHSILPGDIPSAAFVLLSIIRDFPQKTIFLSAVDPGAGNGCGAIAVEAGHYFFVGPNNGVLCLAAAQAGNPIIHELDNRQLFLKPNSTFRGRDIFGPAAAYLSTGADFKKLGTQLDSMAQCPFPRVLCKEEILVGAVVYIDRFGNCISNINAFDLKKIKSKQLFVLINGKKIPVHSRYNDVQKGEALGIMGSAGFLEISINQGSAATALELSIGYTLELQGQ